MSNSQQCSATNATGRKRSIHGPINLFFKPLRSDTDESSSTASTGIDNSLDSTPSVHPGSSPNVSSAPIPGVHILPSGSPYHAPSHLIPKQEIILKNGKIKCLSFQERWYQFHPWLHWDISMKRFLCFHCVCAMKRNHAYATPEEYYRHLFYQFLDNVISCIKRNLQFLVRFDQPTMALLSKLQACILNKDASLLPVEYRDDINIEALTHEFALYHDAFSSINELKNQFASFPRCKQAIFEQIEKLLRIVLVVPPTSTTPERSFSGLRRLLTWLRSSMAQSRLNHLAVLHVHKDTANEIDLLDICKEFTFKDNRVGLFGRFED